MGLVGLVASQGGDLGDLISDVYGTPAPAPGGDAKDTDSAVPGTGACTCVPYYLCANGSVITDGVGLIDIR